MNQFVTYWVIDCVGEDGYTTGSDHNRCSKCCDMTVRYYWVWHWWALELHAMKLCPLRQGLRLRIPMAMSAPNAFPFSSHIKFCYDRNMRYGPEPMFIHFNSGQYRGYFSDWGMTREPKKWPLLKIGIEWTQWVSLLHAAIWYDRRSWILIRHIRTSRI
jgi:hypothetical protein